MIKVGNKVYQNDLCLNIIRNEKSTLSLGDEKEFLLLTFLITPLTIFPGEGGSEFY